MNTDVMRDTLHASENGQRTFPQVVQALTAVGVESYHADFVRAEDTFYLSDGQTHVEKMNLPATAIAENFSAEPLVETIRAVQADQIRYPEFLPRAMAAGTSGYWVYLTGRKIVYFGRKGEFHVEHFPGVRS